MSTEGCTKGMYFTEVVSYISRCKGFEKAVELCAKAGLPHEFKSLENYPIRRLVALQELAIAECMPGLSKDDGFKELGAMSFQTFSQTVLGQATLSIFGRNVIQFCRFIPSYYKFANNFGNVSVQVYSQNSFAVFFEDFLAHPYAQLGTFYEAFRSLGVNAETRLEISRYTDRGEGDIDSDFCIFVNTV
ncbi:MAG: DUF2378 family protein [Myxococcota bacterium]|jgi:uncharacterized protein (TIGR02265 family)